MGKTQRIPVGLPPFVREIIARQVGILGNSESEVIKNIVLMYLTEKELLRKIESNQKKGGRVR